MGRPIHSNGSRCKILSISTTPSSRLEIAAGGHTSMQIGFSQRMQAAESEYTKRLFGIIKSGLRGSGPQATALILIDLAEVDANR